MGNNCIFCKIVNGNIPCTEVYSSDNVLAFLDIAPVNPGHALVIPKGHHETLFDVPGDLSEELFHAMQVVGRAIMNATDADGINVGMNNFEAAGQLVPHAHFHLIPRKNDDGLGLWPQHSYNTQEAMNLLAQKIRKQISE